MVAALEMVAAKDPLQMFEDGDAVGAIARDQAIENGLVMRPVGNKLIISPPLVMTKAEVDELITKAAATLDAVAANLP